MAIPLSLHSRVRKRLKELLAEGEKIVQGVTSVKGETVYNEWMSTTYRTPDQEILDGGRCIQWMTNCLSVLIQILAPESPHRKLIEEFGHSEFATPNGAHYLLAKLRAVTEDFKGGFLDNSWAQIRAEVAADYLSQAQTLLNDGYHVPAVVLAGAVLEDALRKLCTARGISTSKPNGEWKMINSLNDELVKGQVYSPSKADEIRAWAKNRNDAAHGYEDRVSPDDARRMVDGVRAFVSDFVR